MTYKESINRAMLWLAAKPEAIFVGQAVAYPGTSIYRTLEGVPMERRIEFPVAEEMQMGASIGLALEGYCVISIYPRFDFLLLAANQLVNHLDKIEQMSEGKMAPKVIIRTMVGPKMPLDGGPQHTQDHTIAFRTLLQTVRVVKVASAETALTIYQEAYERLGSTLIVESGERYTKE